MITIITYLVLMDGDWTLDRHSTNNRLDLEVEQSLQSQKNAPNVGPWGLGPGYLGCVEGAQKVGVVKWLSEAVHVLIDCCFITSDNKTMH